MILLYISRKVISFQKELNTEDKKGQVKTFEYHYWLGGMFPRKIEFDGTKICPSGIYEIDEFYTFKDSALTQATLGIYIPRTLQITCN